MNWVITGGCGFIGVNLARRILTDPTASIRVVDDLSVGTREALAVVADFAEVDGERPPAHRLELVVADVRDRLRMQAAVAGADVLVHLAAKTGVLPSLADPLADMEVNVGGTLNCLLAARDAGCGRVVFASSGAPLGEQEPPLHEALVPRPLSPYGASKLAGEAYCSAFAGSFGLDTVVLRFSNVYGPYSTHKTSVVAKFIGRALAGEPLTVYGDGSQTRDFIYVDDLIDAVVLAAQRAPAGEVLQIATGRETSVAELTGMLTELLRARGVPAARESLPPQAGEVQRNYADISRARRVLGWEPATRLEDGLRETVRWTVEAAEGR